MTALLTEKPNCEVKWNAQCQQRSVDVHEVINRSQGGAIVPGPKADAQGQRFVATCRPCHTEITDHPAEARRRGWTR